MWQSCNGPSKEVHRSILGHVLYFVLHVFGFVNRHALRAQFPPAAFPVLATEVLATLPTLFRLASGATLSCALLLLSHSGLRVTVADANLPVQEAQEKDIVADLGGIESSLPIR